MKIEKEKRNVELGTSFNNQITGFPVDELNGYMNRSNRSYRDYKSQQYIYLIGVKLMRLLGLELGGKR